MKRLLRIASAMLVALLFFSVDSLKAQVKIGGNPAVIDPFAILELESSRKGLLLPRLDDAGFGAMVTGTPSNVTVGMVVYYTGTLYQGAGLYVKSQAGSGADKWMKVAGSDAAEGLWKIGGNTAIDPATNFLGTTDGQPLIFKTNAAERFRMNADGSFIFNINGVDEDNMENQVLLIAPDGTVKRKTLEVVNKLNGKTGEFDLVIDAQDTYTLAEADASGADLVLKMPILKDNTQEFGFMRYSDLEKLEKLVNGGITVSPIVTNGTQGANGISIVPDNTGAYTVTVGEATATAPGFMGTGAQELAGIKTFNDGIVVNGALDIPQTLYAPSTTPTSYNLLVQDATTVKHMVLPAWKLDGGLATVNGVAGTTAAGDLTFAVDTAAAAGTDVAIVSDALTNTVTVNIPDAAVGTSRGLVNNYEQTFEGKKAFSNAVTVGSATAGNSTLQVSGSIGVKFRKIASGDILIDDYMVFVKPTGSVNVTVTLPNPAECSGRVYIIKREAKAYPVVEANEAFDVIIATLGGTGKFHGQDSTPITMAETTVSVMSDGTNWNILSRGPGL